MRVALDSPRTMQPFSATRALEGMRGSRRTAVGSRTPATSRAAFEVYIRSFPEPIAKLQVSVGGAGAPQWSADGRSLYYVSGRCDRAGAARPGSRAESALPRYGVCPGRERDRAYYGDANFSVTRDGSRIVTPIPESGGYQLVVVPNWITEFRERMAASRK